MSVSEFTSSVGSWSQDLTVPLQSKCFLMDNFILLSYKLSPCGHQENCIPSFFTEFCKIIGGCDSHFHSVFLFLKLHSPYTVFSRSLIIPAFLWVCSSLSILRGGKENLAWYCMLTNVKLRVKLLQVPSPPHWMCHVQTFFFTAIQPLWGVT